MIAIKIYIEYYVNQTEFSRLNFWCSLIMHNVTYFKITYLMHYGCKRMHIKTAVTLPQSSSFFHWQFNRSQLTFRDENFSLTDRFNGFNVWSRDNEWLRTFSLSGVHDSFWLLCHNESHAPFRFPLLEISKFQLPLFTWLWLSRIMAVVDWLRVSPAVRWCYAHPVNE